MCCSVIAGFQEGFSWDQITGANIYWRRARSDLERDNFLLVVAEQVGVEADEMLADVQAALQQYSLPQGAHKLVTDVLRWRYNSKQG